MQQDWEKIPDEQLVNISQSTPQGVNIGPAAQAELVRRLKVAMVRLHKTSFALGIVMAVLTAAIVALTIVMVLQKSC